MVDEATTRHGVGRRRVSWIESMASAGLIVALMVGVWAIVSGRCGRASTEDVATSLPVTKAVWPMPKDATLDEPWGQLSADRMYERIDGRSTLFEQYGVDGLDFAVASMGGVQLDIEVYRMRTPKAAAGVFSAEKSAGAKAVELSGGVADASGGLVRGVKGAVYVRVMRMDGKKEDATSSAVVRSILADVKAVEDPTAAIRAILPNTGQLADSMEFMQADAWGFQSLSEVWVAAYEIDDETFSACAGALTGERSAAKVFDALKKEIVELGGNVSVCDERQFVGEAMDERIVLCAKDGVIVGVKGELSAERATMRAERLLARIGAK